MYVLEYLGGVIMNAEQKRAWLVLGAFGLACLAFAVGILTLGLPGAWGAFGITGLANAITMTPGTLSVEVNEKESSLYVHWIDVKTVKPEQTSRQIAWPFERFLRRIFR